MHPLRQFTVVFVLLFLVTAGAATAANGTVIEYSGDELVLDAAADQQIHGTTPFEEGTVVGIRVKSIGDTHPFLVSKAIRVGENGTFVVSFDLDELAPLRGGPVEISIRHNESEIHAIEGVLVTNNMPDGSTLSPPTTSTDRPSTEPSTETTTTTTTRTSSSGFEIPGFGVLAAVGSILALAVTIRTTRD
ncbi:hypothetical protein C455_01757 [Haloferax larsenii JCM 13917]|nr:BGTF surface domain-containing protein [Haloferax larsenii]ELZ84386.1 hypothetical protein C455_01757 [Haloferax larsenii JCM 13917]